MNRKLLVLWAAAFLPWTDYVAKHGMPADLSTVTLRLGVKSCAKGKNYQAQIAREDLTRQKGLSLRKNKLKPDEAMLFVYDPARPVEIWMIETYIPLAVGFYGADNRLMKRYEMPVEKDPKHPSRTYPSEGLASGVIEVPPGAVPKDSVLCALDSPR
jgi:uncharacterized membrane protein (UPF0127 family)